MSSNRTVSKLQQGRPPRDPQIDCGGHGGEQLCLLVTDEWDALTHAERHRRMHSMVACAVNEYEGGPIAFAAKIERPIPEVSRRLRRAEDSHGEIQRAPLEYLDYLDADARAAFLEALSQAWGFRRPERVRQLTADEKARAMRELVTDKALRAWEREHGLPAGTLEP